MRAPSFTVPLLLALAGAAAAATPAITDVSPNPIDAGGLYFLLSVTGSGFVPGSIVRWNGQPLDTLYLGATQLKAVITAETRALARKVDLTVVNGLGGVSSNIFPFNVNPVLFSVTPALVFVGSTGITITATGAGFTRNHALLLQSPGAPAVALPTTYVDSTTLAASVPPSALSAARAASLQVVDSAGSDTSAAVDFAIRALPVVASVSPKIIDAGGPFFNLTVTGSGFTPDTTVYWAGTPVGTAYTSPTELQASITSELRALAGKFAITAGAAGAVSNAWPVTVSPVLAAVNPAAARAGSQAVAIAATGLGFTRASLLALTAAGQSRQLATTYVSANSLSGVIPADALTASLTAKLQVLDPVGGGASVALDFRIDPAAPSIAALTPGTVTAGATAFPMTVTGANFAAGAVVQWNGSALATAVAGSTQLTATVPASLVANPGSAAVTVVKAGAPASNAVSFTIAGRPALVSLNPSAAALGSAVTLVVAGANFLPGAAVMWNAVPVSTTFNNSGQLTATLAGDLLAAAGPATVTVLNPGGAASGNALVFTVTPPRPSITNVSPKSAAAGADSATLTLAGANFAWNSTVEWNGAPLATTYIAPGQLTAVAPAVLLALPGSASLTVLNASGLASNAVTFAVTPSSPAITALTPAAAIAGSGGFTLTVGGRNFAPGAVVTWNGTPLATIYVDANRVTAAIPAARLAAEGTAAVKVTASGLDSAAADFPIVKPSPAVTVTAVINAAAADAAIAPGSLISIFGDHLAAAAPAQTMVLVNGAAAPILFVSATQINAQAPFELKPGTAVLAVQADGAASTPVTFEVKATGPGLLTMPRTTHALAQNWPGGAVNAPDTPAAAGDYVTLYLTGQGAVDQTVATGAVSPSDPLAQPLAAVEVWVGDQPATVAFAGLAPGFIGLLQVNIVVPAVAAGEQPLRITIGGVAANAAVLSVR